ncbi:MAG: hypothetical protein NUV54_02270, partial [Candidatus Taylorbacteria bacterium]|nr:hypothetical protein [Candidatus Taylorbacteria bacterium]
NEEKGMDINAGVIFIPEAAVVDKRTGSRYELDEQHNPIKSMEYYNAIARVVEDPDFHEFAEQVMNTLEGISGASVESRDETVHERLTPFRLRLEEEFGITDTRLQCVFFRSNTLLALRGKKQERDAGEERVSGTLESEIESVLQERGVLFKETKDGVLSKVFWEDYFSKNPSKKPSKIIYYSEASPTEALHGWRERNKIRKKTGDPAFGFPERQVDTLSPEATSGMSRFRALGEEVIEKYYQVK